MPIKITSTKDGFRRCGVAHSKQPTVHKDGIFTNEQIETLKNESMLVVEIVDSKSANGKNDARQILMAMTVPQLKEMGAKYDCQETTKEKLVDEILAAQAKES